MTPKDLAAELGVSPKTLRAWLREEFPRKPEDHGKRWRISPAMAVATRRRFSR
jgi:DNA-binding transcriptional MerR regulator